MPNRNKASVLSGVEKPIERSKFVGNNTLYIEYADDAKAWRLHDTDVVTQLPNGNFELNSGGWRTNTTKDRINRFSPVRVFQENSIWYCNGGTAMTPFYDGMQFTKSGELVTKPIKDPLPQVREMKRRIKGYVDLCKKGLPEPSSGDCWICMLPNHKESPDHLLSHIEERYLHGTILVNAILDHPSGTEKDLPYIWSAGWQVPRMLRRYLYSALLSGIGSC